MTLLDDGHCHPRGLDGMYGTQRPGAVANTGLTVVGEPLCPSLNTRHIILGPPIVVCRGSWATVGGCRAVSAHVRARRGGGPSMHNHRSGKGCLEHAGLDLQVMAG